MLEFENFKMTDKIYFQKAVKGVVTNKFLKCIFKELNLGKKSFKKFNQTYMKMKRVGKNSFINFSLTFQGAEEEKVTARR